MPEARVIPIRSADEPPKKRPAKKAKATEPPVLPPPPVAPPAEWERKLAGLNVEIVHRTRWTLYLRDPEGNRLGLSHFPHEA